MAAEGDLGRIGVSGLGSIKNKKMFESHSLVTEGERGSRESEFDAEARSLDSGRSKGKNERGASGGCGEPSDGADGLPGKERTEYQWLPGMWGGRGSGDRGSTRRLRLLMPGRGAGWVALGAWKGVYSYGPTRLNGAIRLSLRQSVKNVCRTTPSNS